MKTVLTLWTKMPDVALQLIVEENTQTYNYPKVKG